jgi:hypothetical protein
MIESLSLTVSVRNGERSWTAAGYPAALSFLMSFFLVLTCPLNYIFLNELHKIVCVIDIEEKNTRP